MNNYFEISKPFSEQYTLTIDSDIKGVNVHMISKTQMRWDFVVLKVKDGKYEIRLVLLDHILLESNNPLIKEVASYTNAFSRLYNELHLLINSQGIIIEVINKDFIASKWKQTKLDMEEIAGSNPDLKNVIKLNDNVFYDQIKFISNIQNSEFFLMYFNKVFGKKVPGTFSVNTLNIFNSTNVHWTYNLSIIENSQIDSNEIIIKSIAEPSINLNLGFNNRAYIQFANQININKLDPSLIEKGIFRIDQKTGRLVEASLIREEIAETNELFVKLKYTLYSDEIMKYKISNEFLTTKN